MKNKKTNEEFIDNKDKTMLADKGRREKLSEL